jgi:hypothetical protein
LVTGNYGSITGKLRVEIWKTRFFQIKIPVVFFLNLEKKQVFRFQPKRNWIKGARGIYIYVYPLKFMFIQQMGPYWEGSPIGLSTVVGWFTTPRENMDTMEGLNKTIDMNDMDIL